MLFVMHNVTTRSRFRYVICDV